MACREGAASKVGTKRRAQEKESRRGIMVQNVVNENPTCEVILKVPIFASKEEILHDDENAGKTCLGRTWPEYRPFQILQRHRSGEIPSRLVWLSSIRTRVKFS